MFDVRDIEKYKLNKTIERKLGVMYLIYM